MKIAVASDHAGWNVKRWLVDQLRSRGHEVVDFGTDSEEPCDYPDYAAKAARAVADGRCEQGILVCGTGVGMAIVANKVQGIRAAASQCPEAARLGRAHNDANVLCLGARITTLDVMREILNAWFSARFEGGRHEKRVNKIKALEHDKTCS